MTEPPSGKFLLDLGADLSFPPVTLGTLTLRGAAAWRDAMPRTAPIERRRWLRALGEPLLVATPSSRERLDAWRRSPAPRLPAAPEWLREHVLFYGDISVLGPVVAALRRLPPAVRDHTLTECCFQAVGAESRAWTGASTFVDRDGKGRPRVIQLSGAAPHAPFLVGTILHEVAHSWTCATPSALVSALGEEAFCAYLAAEGRGDLADTKRAFDERLAHALAWVWGSEDV